MTCKLVWQGAGLMKTARKITVEVSRELLKKAQLASGTGITQTVRTGCSSWRHRALTLACANSEARFASLARWRS
jgi:hypothetical protein